MCVCVCVYACVCVCVCVCARVRERERERVGVSFWCTVSNIAAAPDFSPVCVSVCESVCERETVCTCPSRVLRLRLRRLLIAGLRVSVCVCG